MSETMIPRGNLSRLSVISVVLSPAQVAANTTAERLFTVPMVRQDDVILDVTKPSSQAGLGIVNSRVSAANQVGITFINCTASPITPTAGETYQLLIGRRDSPVSAFS